MIKYYNFIIEGKLNTVCSASKAEAYQEAKQIIYEMKQIKDSD